MKTRTSVLLSTASLCLSLSACDWVDSTGAQSAVSSRTEVFLDDTPIGSVNAINEKTVARITIDRNSPASDGTLYSWSDSPLDQGALPTCAALSGFNLDIAATSLETACSTGANCSVAFEPVDDSAIDADFTFLVPELKASVGLRYALTTTTAEGTSSSRDYDFCLIAINEAPDANDDTFVIRAGERETFSASGIC